MTLKRTKLLKQSNRNVVEGFHQIQYKEISVYVQHKRFEEDCKNIEENIRGGT